MVVIEDTDAGDVQRLAQALFGHAPTAGISGALPEGYEVDDDTGTD